ncbi:retropepsin-like aspartic protease [uncultured Neptuniibacter sp.]|uniref:retropepsin-like aspartic protease n=1 Tax=uncultured Neptuniibacter sp. TaxID=502143 RepID=UPI00260C1673|nr:retropepsin-like aspartic protease [uncultured Neptuniibacter sp.]
MPTKQIITKLFLLYCMLSFSEVQARIYEYKDDSGRRIFVDRLSQVPAKYRDQLRSREEEKDQLDRAALNRLQVERKTKSAALKISVEKARIREAMEKWITPFELRANQILVPVTVVYGSRTGQLTLVMDTGASYTVVHKDSIKPLGAYLRPGGAAMVADGSVVKTQQVTFDRVEIGPYKSTNVTAGVLDFRGGATGSDGLLGMDFLYNARYKLDRENQKIYWDPEKYQQLKEQLAELEKMEQQLNNPPTAPDTSLPKR